MKYTVSRVINTFAVLVNGVCVDEKDTLDAAITRRDEIAQGAPYALPAGDTPKQSAEPPAGDQPGDAFEAAAGNVLNDAFKGVAVQAPAKPTKKGRKAQAVQS